MAMLLAVKGKVEIYGDYHYWKEAHVEDLLYPEDWVHTGTRSSAKLLLKDGSEIVMGENSGLYFPRPPKPALWHKAGDLLLRMIKGQVDFEIRSPYGCVGIEGTEFTHCLRQKIAFVNGNDLWLMNEDGTGRAIYIAAPSGKKIGRSTFSPNGSNIVYEVWDTGDNSYPDLMDLWIADIDGSNARPLLSAGSLSDPTGKEDFSYKARLLQGPCFSPDGTEVSCLRVEFFQRWIPEISKYLLLRVQEVGTVPVAGGPFRPVTKTQRRSTGMFLDPYDAMESEYSLWEGNNTAWATDNRIYFGRDGTAACWFYSRVDALNTELSAWPCEINALWMSERGLAPSYLRVTLDGETLDLLPYFKGYGYFTYNTSAEPAWYPYPSTDWQTPKMGSLYGPVTTHAIPETSDTALLEGSDGTEWLSESISNLVSKGMVGCVNGELVFFDYTITTNRRGVWCVNGSGGEESYFTPRMGSIGSLVWNHSSTVLAVDGNSVPAALTFIDANGEDAVHWLIPGNWHENYLGNWDENDRRILFSFRRGGSNVVAWMDAESGSIQELGSGEFPMFLSWGALEVNCFDGLVSVMDAEGKHGVSCGPGQAVRVDALANGGFPQPATVFAGPYVTNVIPPWGSAVATNKNPSITLQFNTAVASNSLESNVITGLSWPMHEESSYLDVVGWSATLLQSNNPNAFNDTLRNAQSRGIGTGHWNAAHTEFTFAVTNRNFCVSGNSCELSIDLSGVQSAGGASLAFNEASTRFRFIDLAGTNGGEVCTMEGAKVIAPAGAFPNGTVVEGTRQSDLPSGSSSPTTGSWRQASALYAITSSASPVSSVIVEIKLGAYAPNASIWRYDGTNWVNLGGSYSATDGVIRASSASLSSFCVFYRAPTGPWLRLSKDMFLESATGGQTVAFSILLQNLGQAAASGIVVTDALPVGLEYVAGSVSTNGTYEAGTRTLRWNLGMVGAGSNVLTEFEAILATSVVYGAAVTNIARTGPTNSNPCAVKTALPMGKLSCFGVGSAASTNWSAMKAVGSGWRRVLATVNASQCRDTNLLSGVLSWFDAQVRTNQATGLRTYAILSVAAQTSVWPSATAFANTLGIFVERYDGDGMNDMSGLTLPLHHWEIFEEFQNNTSVWAGCSVEMYRDYLMQSYVVAHAQDPDVTVLSSAIVEIPGSSETNFLQRLMALYPEAADFMDAVSIHDHWAQERYGSIVEYLEIFSLRDFLEGIGLSGKPIWGTVTDFTSTYNYRKGQGIISTQDDNARFLACSYPFALAGGYDRLIYSEMEWKSGYGEALSWAVMIDSNTGSFVLNS